MKILVLLLWEEKIRLKRELYTYHYQMVTVNTKVLYFLFLYFKFIYFNWRLITLQYYGGFGHTLT